MRIYLTTLAIAVLLSLGPAVARAQDDPKVGVTMGYPSGVGVLWHVSERVALRPEFTVSTGSSETTSSDSLLGRSSTTAPNDSWQTGIGLGALFYVSRRDRLRTYISPRFVYATSSSNLGIAGAQASTGIDTWSYSTTGSFGAEYSLGRHFSVFGEIGLGYTSTTSRLTTAETIFNSVIAPGGGITVQAGILQTFTVRSDTHTRSTGTRSGAGVVFFF